MVIISSNKLATDARHIFRICEMKVDSHCNPPPNVHTRESKISEKKGQLRFFFYTTTCTRNNVCCTYLFSDEYYKLWKQINH